MFLSNIPAQLFQKFIVTQFSKKLRTSWKLFLLLQDKMKMQKIQYPCCISPTFVSFHFRSTIGTLEQEVCAKQKKLVQRFWQNLCSKQQCPICFWNIMDHFEANKSQMKKTKKKTIYHSSIHSYLRKVVLILLVFTYPIFLPSLHLYYMCCTYIA